MSVSRNHITASQQIIAYVSQPTQLHQNQISQYINQISGLWIRRSTSTF